MLGASDIFLRKGEESETKFQPQRTSGWGIYPASHVRWRELIIINIWFYDSVQHVIRTTLRIGTNQRSSLAFISITSPNSFERLNYSILSFQLIVVCLTFGSGRPRTFCFDSPCQNCCKCRSMFRPSGRVDQFLRSKKPIPTFCHFHFWWFSLRKRADSWGRCLFVTLNPGKRRPCCQKIPPRRWWPFPSRFASRLLMWAKFLYFFDRIVAVNRWPIVPTWHFQCGWPFLWFLTSATTNWIEVSNDRIVVDCCACCPPVDRNPFDRCTTGWTKRICAVGMTSNRCPRSRCWMRTCWTGSRSRMGWLALDDRSLDVPQLCPNNWRLDFELCRSTFRCGNAFPPFSWRCLRRNCMVAPWRSSKAIGA